MLHVRDCGPDCHHDVGEKEVVESRKQQIATHWHSPEGTHT